MGKKVRATVYCNRKSLGQKLGRGGRDR
jgi:hypothetical protein